MKCEDCEHWMGYMDRKSRGRCRRYPPVHAGMKQPDTYRWDWCGEYAVDKAKILNEIRKKYEDTN